VSNIVSLAHYKARRIAEARGALISDIATDLAEAQGQRRQQQLGAYYIRMGWADRDAVREALEMLRGER